MSIPFEFAAACCDVAMASDADTVGGCQARWVAAPASTEEASALMRAAAELKLTVVPRGTGRLQHWGNPPDRCDLIVDTRRMDQIVEHPPGDLAVTVQAGVRLPDIERFLEAASQTLGILPSRKAWADTVGGLIATNAAGSFGTLRERLTGITAVRADGVIVRTGHVAPKVAGQDLVTLFTGSYGSLGLITEAAFLLRPLPEVTGGVLLPCTDPEHAARLVQVVSDRRMASAGIGLRWPSADAPIGLIVRIEGDRQGAQVRRERLHALAGRPAPSPIDFSGARRPDAADHGKFPAAIAQEMLGRRERMHAELLDPPIDTGTLVRVSSFSPAQLARALTAIQAAAVGSGVAAGIEGSASACVLYARVPAETHAAAVARFVAALRAELGRLVQAGKSLRVPRAVVVYAPDEVRNLTDMHGPVSSPARMREIKDEFDPDNRMAPGRLADVG